MPPAPEVCEENLLFPGEFAAPLMGFSVAGINITGRGSISLGRDKMVVQGYKKANRDGWVFLGVLGVLFSYLATSVLLKLSGATFPDEVHTLVALTVLVSAAGLRLRKTSPRPGTPRLRLVYGKQHVKSVSRYNESGVVLIVVKGAKPKGGVYFIPDDGSDALLAAFNARM